VTEVSATPVDEGKSERKEVEPVCSTEISTTSDCLTAATPNEEELTDEVSKISADLSRLSTTDMSNSISPSTSTENLESSVESPAKINKESEVEPQIDSDSTQTDNSLEHTEVTSQPIAQPTA
jgi:hypothetical protein